MNQELSEKAIKFYESKRLPNTATGYERYVACGGGDCYFVNSDYIPENGESVFCIKTENGITVCQAHSHSEQATTTTKNKENSSKYTIEPTRELNWRVTDIESGASITFREGLFSETAAVDDPSKLKATTNLTDIRDWVKEEYPILYSCNIWARIRAIKQLNVERYWQLMAVALKRRPLRSTLMAHRFAIKVLEHVEDYLWSNEKRKLILNKTEQQKLLSILEDLSNEEAKEVANIIKAYWLSDHTLIRWTEWLFWWPSFVPISSKAYLVEEANDHYRPYMILTLVSIKTKKRAYWMMPKTFYEELCEEYFTDGLQDEYLYALPNHGCWIGEDEEGNDKL